MAGLSPDRDTESYKGTFKDDKLLLFIFILEWRSYRAK